jgi:hypothetical protein
MCTAPAGITIKAPSEVAARTRILQIFEQRQALRQREGLQRCAKRGVLLIKTGNRFGVIQPLQTGD